MRHIHQFPAEEQVVAMTTYRGQLILATTKGLYLLTDAHDPSVKLVPVEIVPAG